MTTIGRYLKNTAFITFTIILRQVLTIIFTLVAANKLGAAGFGIYSAALGFVLLVGELFDFGLSSLLIRELSRHRGEEGYYYRNYLGIKLLIAIPSYLIIVFTGRIIGFSTEVVSLIPILAIFAFLAGFEKFNTGFFYAIERMEFETIIQTVRNTCILLFVVLVLFSGLGLVPFAWAVVAGGSAGFLAGITIIRRYISHIRPERHASFWKNIGREVWPFGTAALLIATYQRIGIVILSTLVSDAEVGYYSVGYNIMGALLIVSVALTGSLNPIISRLTVTDRKKSLIVYRSGFKLLLLTGLPIATCGSILSTPIIKLLFSPEYLPASSSLIWFLWATPVIYIKSLADTTLNALNRQRIWLLSTAISAGINIGLNYLLIPKFSHVGAAMAFLFAQFVGFLIVYRVIKSVLGGVKFVDTFIRPILPMLLVTTMVWFIRNFNLALVITSAVVIYFLLCWYAGALGETEKELVISAVREWRKKKKEKN